MTGPMIARDMEHVVTVIGHVIAAFETLSGERNVRGVVSRGVATKKLNVSVSGFSSGVMFNFVSKRLGNGSVGFLVIRFDRSGIGRYLRWLVNFAAHVA